MEFNPKMGLKIFGIYEFAGIMNDIVIHNAKVYFYIFSNH